MARFLVALVAVLLATSAAHAKTVLVLDPETTPPDDALAGVVAERLATVTAKETGFEVSTLADVRQRLKLEQHRQILGCETGTCAAAVELGAPLGADYLVQSAIRTVDSTLHLSLGWVDVAGGRVLRRETKTFPTRAALLEALPGVVDNASGGATGPEKTVRLAILYFDNTSKSDELDPLRKGLADMLIADLASAAGVKVIEREKLEALKGELALQQTTAIDATTAQKLGKLLGVEYLVFGSYLDLMGSLRLDARVVRVETGAIEQTATAAGKRDLFLDLEQKLAQTLATKLERTAVPAARGTVPLAQLVQYSKILDLLDAGRLEEAKPLVAALRAEAPSFGAAQVLAARILP